MLKRIFVFAGKIRIEECVIALTFFAILIHVIAWIFGVPLTVETFDTLR